MIGGLAGSAGRTESPLHDRQLIYRGDPGSVTAQRLLTPKLDVPQVQRTAEAMRTAIASVIEGKTEQIDLAILVLFAGGHLLIEDVPGVGKTMLAKALGRAIDCRVRRIQFTPDLLPSDITGVSVYNQETREFEFKPGGVFANIVVGDEINRASPKTQSALLEAMEERQVSVDGQTHRLRPPFMVVATQNPIEMEGTYPLPEAQRDRFMARIEMGYPTRGAELEMLSAHGAANPLASLQPVTDSATLTRLAAGIGEVHVSQAVKEYIVDIVDATRSSSDLRLGASPRAGLQLLRAVRVRAAVTGRDYVIPDDVQALLASVLSHRVLLTSAARLAGRSGADAVTAAAATVALPRSI